MKKIKFLLPVFATLIFSCSDYLDVNDDPNRALYPQIPANELLPAAQVGIFRTQAINMNQLGNVFMNSWSPNVASFTGGYANEQALNVDNAFYRQIFENIYLNAYNFQTIINMPNDNHVNDNFVIASKICKAYYMQYLVDLYGDIPYTEAFANIKKTTPRYNDDQFVYRQLLGELDDARALFAAANAAAAPMANTDVMFKGDLNKWMEFANTIELRMLLRMSNNTGAVATYRDDRMAGLLADGHGSGVTTFVTYDVTINPGYNGSNDNQMNPFNANFTYDSAGAATNNWTFVAMSGHAYKYLRSYAPSNNQLIDAAANPTSRYPGVNDIRAARIFRGTLRGVTQGSNLVDIPGSGTPARIGYGCVNPNIQYPNDPNLVAITVDDLIAMSGNDGYVMTASEAYFLQAEAMARGWMPGGSAGAQSAFETGIEKSFDFRGITVLAPTDYSSYLAAIASKPGLGWPASTTLDQQIEAIMVQKWIALMGIHGIESFIEYNRTGYPVTPKSLIATQSRKPRRLIYPVSEYIANSANVPNITPTQVFAATDPSHPFWMLGNPTLGN